jgi:hypothetical protein
MHAMNQLVDRIGKPAVGPVEKMMRDKKSSPEQSSTACGCCIVSALTLKILSAAATRCRPHCARTPRACVIGNRRLTPAHRKLALGGLRDDDAHVQRAAADALGCHPNPEHIRPLLDARRQHRPSIPN